jgi:hypothetical protein
VIKGTRKALSWLKREVSDRLDSRPDKLVPGDVAPDFAVRDHGGRLVSLAALRGKNVVLWFYPKADTPG